MSAAARVAAAALLAGALGGFALGGCTSVKNGLGPHDSICFSTIPEARHLVGKSPHFAGVRYITPGTLRHSVERRFHRHVTFPPRLAKRQWHAACLVAFSGQLSNRLVTMSWHPGPGPYRFVIVVIRLDGHRLLGTIVMARSPLGFGDFG